VTRKQADELIKETAQKLAEHFDAVQILVSWDCEEDKEWAMEYNGSGNWYARRGMMQEVLQRDEGANHAQSFKEANPPPTEEDDGWKAGA